MARNESVVVNTLAYLGVRTIGTALHCFDVDRAMAALGTLGDCWYHRDRRRRQRTIGNLKRSFPELDKSEIEELARRSMRHLLQMFVVEVILAPRLLTGTTWHKYVRLGQLEEAMAVLNGKGPAIFITGHCGNFEVLGATMATVGYPLIALARPLDLPRINDWLMEIRQRRGMTILTKFGATERLPRILDNGGRVAFIADQNAGDKGLFVPFFRRLASAYKTIGLLAMRHNAPILCGHAKRTHPDRFQYEINVREVIHPRDWADQPDPLYYLTARYTRAIENMVREAPEQYFWVHRRWKSRPRHERLGRPMPDSLKRKIAALPWVDEAELERIVDTSNAEAAVAEATLPEIGADG